MAAGLAANGYIDDAWVALLAFKLVASVAQVAHYRGQHARLVARAARQAGPGAVGVRAGWWAGRQECSARHASPEARSDAAWLPALPCKLQSERSRQDALGHLGAMLPKIHSGSHLCRPTPVMTWSITPPGWPSPPSVTRYLPGGRGSHNQSMATEGGCMVEERGASRTPGTWACAPAS